MEMIYQQACKWDKPKHRTFTFDKPTTVQVNRNIVATDVLSLKLPIYNGQKVYATNQPKTIKVGTPTLYTNK